MVRTTDKKRTFTLAEVLIVIGLVGVVAALTIPTLYVHIQEKVKSHQLEVIEKRMVEGLNVYNTMENSLNGKQYKDSEEFVKGLSKYFKMAAVCGENNIAECIPYQAVSFDKYDGSLSSIEVSSLASLQNLNLKEENFYKPASFITASGTPFILAVKKNCIEDPDVALENYSSCIDGLYDYNGSKGPNKFGEDIISIFSAGPERCVAKGGGVCFATTAFIPTSEEAIKARDNCNSIKNNGYFMDNGKKITVSKINNCPWQAAGDYWLAAKIKCESQGFKLPSAQQLADLATNYTENDWVKHGFVTSYIAGIRSIVIWGDKEHAWLYSADCRIYTWNGSAFPYSLSSDRDHAYHAFCVPK